MPKFTEYQVTTEVRQWMEKIIEYYPKGMFKGFEPDSILTVFTLGKKGKKGKLARLVPLRYPHDVAVDGKKVYIAEIKGGVWRSLSDRKKWMAIINLMCQIPEEGFNEESKEYAKKKKPDYEMFKQEFEAANGVPNWLEDDSKLAHLPAGQEISDSPDSTEEVEVDEEELVEAE